MRNIINGFLFIAILALSSSHLEAIKVNSIDGFSIQKKRRAFQSIPIEGTEHIIVQNNNNKSTVESIKPLKISGKFKLNSVSAQKQARHFLKRQGIPFLDTTYAPSKRIWLYQFGQTRPAWKTRLPALHVKQLRNIWVDAENGEILLIQPAAKWVKAPAQAYIYAPKGINLSLSELKDVSLEVTSNDPNSHVGGQFFKTYNCCLYYTCPDDQTTCSDKEKICARFLSESANLNQIELKLAGNIFEDLGYSFAESLYLRSPRCSNVPSATNGFKPGTNIFGFFEMPIDGSDYSALSDDFAEVQTYFVASDFFNFMRALLGSDFCLRSQAMSCDGQKTFPLLVNQLVPHLNLDLKDASSIPSQLKAGRGSKEDPLQIDSMITMSNAAFIPAIEEEDSNVTLEDALDYYLFPFDYLVLYQGAHDTAYDGDVIAHELMHAFTQTLAPDLLSYGADSLGAYSDPGAINEAWSDYFAGLFTKSDKIGEYSAFDGSSEETSIRDLNTPNTCQQMTGEVHDDSLILSNALWNIQQIIFTGEGQPAVETFNRIVLAGIMQASATETFVNQAKLILDAVENSPDFGQSTIRQLKPWLDDIISCERIIDISDKPKEVLYQQDPKYIGLKNVAPSFAQLKIITPPSTSSITLTWRQYEANNGTKATDKTGSYPINPLKVIINPDKPNQWTYDNRTALINLQSSLLEEKNTSNNASYKNSKWSFQYDLPITSCQPSTYYVSFANFEQEFLLKDISVSFEKGNGTCVEPPPTAPETTDTASTKGCNCTQTSNGGTLSFWVFAIGLIWMIWRRRIAK